jgi:hypothetical protein
MGRKHNKRRNTGFVYEVLIREITKCVLEKQEKRKTIALKLLKEHFSPLGVLGQELDCYKTLTETKSLDKYTAEKMIHKVRQKFLEIDRQKVLLEQNAVIAKINRRLGAAVFDNFVPNYKSLATISSIFNEKTSVKKKVLYENSVLDSLMEATSKEGQADQKNTLDEVVFREFAKKFNTTYGGLSERQRELIKVCVLEADKESTTALFFLNEELSRIKGNIERSLLMKEVASDEEMIENTKKVLEMLDELRTYKKPDDSFLIKVLKMQNLVGEYED